MPTSPKTPSPAENPSHAYRVVATDLDGTLCEVAKVHPTTHDAIAKLKENDIMILPVTGRGPDLARPILELCGLPSYPGGYHHGALTYDSEGKILLNKTIPHETLDALIEAVDRMVAERGVFAAVVAQCKANKYSIYEHADIDVPLTATRWDISVVKEDGSVRPSTGSLVRQEGRSATRSDMTEEDLKALYQATILNKAVEDAATIEWQKQIIAECCAKRNLVSLKTHASGRYFIDTIHHDADKSSAIYALGERYGFSTDSVLALGDNQNDMGMLKCAGKAVAMGNARDDVKSCAHFVTDSCSAGGWAKAIDELMFKD